MPVFGTSEAITESDAVMAECSEWIEVSRGAAETLDLLETKGLVLSRIDERSGHTEASLAGDGFGPSVADLGKCVRPRSAARRARDETAIKKARDFVTGQ